jgi:hypothetical protein
MIRAAVPGISEREIGSFIAKIKEDPKIRYPSAWLKTVIDKGDLADVIADAAQGGIWEQAMERARQQDAVKARPWCGRCDERTRLLGDPPARCPACHPLTMQPIEAQALAAVNGTARDEHGNFGRCHGNPDRTPGLVANCRQGATCPLAAAAVVS